MMHETVIGVCLIAAVAAVVAWRWNTKNDHDENITRVRKKASDLDVLECAVVKLCKELKDDR